MKELDSRIRDLIVRNGWLTAHEIDRALAELAEGTSLPDHLRARGLLRDDQVAEMLTVAAEAQTISVHGLDTTVVEAPEVTPATEASRGERVGNYRILRRLGRGGMGEVFLAVQEGLDRQVALKVLAGALLDHPELQERFQREAEALARLSHPNITGVFDYGVHEGRSFIVMEYVAGGSLHERIAGRPYALGDALRIVSKVLEALAYAHGLGVVHRDIKPANVLIAGDGAVKVADFGLAKIVAEDVETPELTLTDHGMGTPHYMAPEQVKSSKHIDHRADLYSVGVVLYEMITGTKPLGRFDPPSQAAGVDPAIDPIVVRLLEIDPAARYPSATEALEDLQAVQEKLGVAERRASRKHAAGPRQLLLVLAGVVVIALGAWLASTWLGGGDGEADSPPETRDLFEHLLIGPDDVPPPYPWPPAQPSSAPLPRNPFLAKTEAERSALLTYLDSQGLKAVSAAEVGRAYHHRLGYSDPLPALTLLEFLREEDARRAASMILNEAGGTRWAHREGRLLVFVARSPHRSVEQQRYAFEYIVSGIQRKLGQEVDDLDGLRPFYLDDDITLAAFPDAGFGCSAYLPPMKYLLEREWRIDIAPDAIRRLYVGAFSEGSSERGWMGLEYVVARAEDPAVRDALAAGWRTLGGNPLERPPFVGAVIVSRLRPADDTDTLAREVSRAHAQLERILADKFGTTAPPPPELTLETLIVSRRELPDNARFAAEPGPPVTGMPRDALISWCTARSLAPPTPSRGAVVATWTADIVPHDVHVLLVECANPESATALAEELTRAITPAPRSACRTRGSLVAVIVQGDDAVSGANTFYSLLGRLAFKLLR